ncbi:hypothetical protein L218DRAFT_961929 [Marasmius fiardii PR-910]|nr:hypothetical protein L218DRAFT_961929 [Marasmius fiardii PR-910]
MSASVINSYFPGSMRDVHPVVSDIETAEESPGAVAVAPSSTSSSNPTVLPNSFLTTITPIIMIRHPVRMISSAAKVMFRGFSASTEDPGLALACSYKWSRTLFDYLKELSPVSGMEPIVVDGDVMVEDVEKQMKELCGLIGVDGGRVRYEWEPKGVYTPMNKEMNEHVFLKDLYESTRVIKDKVCFSVRSVAGS